MYETHETRLSKLVGRIFIGLFSLAVVSILLSILSEEYIFHPEISHSEQIDGTLVKQNVPTLTPSDAQKPIVQPPLKLGNTDDVVRRAVNDFAPNMSAWLSPHQIRSWVYAIDMMADGNIPKKNRPVVFRMREFQVTIQGTGDNTRYYAASNRFSKDMIVDNLVVIDPARLAHYYQSWLPILETAYHDMGGKDKFDHRFQLAVARILAVKPLTSKSELLKIDELYIYADPELESTTDVEKMMWRLGTKNIRKTQNFLKQLLAEIQDTKNPNT